MKHIHVAALEPDAEFARRIGKKGSESDFTIYNCKEGGRVLCIYHANKYPERVQPLLYCLSLCDIAYLRPSSIDKHTGEMIVACAVFGRKLLVLADRVGKEDIEPLLKAAGVKDYEFFEGDANALRERLLEAGSLRKGDGKTEVVIDACFPVKGIGTVALGIVQQGTVAVHQRLALLPSGKTSEVKSIQVQDEDAKEAEASSRVGLSLRDLEADEVERGEVAAEERLAPASRVEAEVSLTKFYKGDLCSLQFFAHSLLRFVACKAKRLEAGKYELELAQPLVAQQGEEIYLFLAEAMPRIVGSARITRVIG